MSDGIREKKQQFLRQRIGRKTQMKKLIYTLLGVVIVLSCIYLFHPAPIVPEAWTPPPGMAFEGPLQKNIRLQKGVEELGKGILKGPEEVVMAKNGILYTGTRDGKIMRLAPGSEPELVADTHGRPLGMKFDNAGNLVVCDAVRGLLSVSPAGYITTLAVSADDIPIKFANALDISRENIVYFTDASFRHGMEQTMHELLEARPYGRLMAYDSGTGKVSVLIKRLHFANGVALSQDEDFVLVNETYRYRTLRYWLKGPKAGSVEIFLDRLPGFPDNISNNGKGIFWLALYTIRSKSLDTIHPYPIIKAQLSKLPVSLWPKPQPYGLVLALDHSGKIIQSLHDPDGEYVREVTSVREYNGFLYLGSLDRDSVVKLPLVK